MPVGTGNSITLFNVGDRVIIRHMFDLRGDDFIDAAYSGYQMRDQTGKIVNISSQRLAFQVRVKIDDPKFRNILPSKLENFSPNEIELLDEIAPDWEV